MVTVESRTYPANLVREIVAKHLRVTPYDEELYSHAVQCVKNALQVAEDYTNRIILNSEVVMEVQSQGAPVIWLPTAPVRSITSVRVNGQDILQDGYSWVSNAHRAMLHLSTAAPEGAMVEVCATAGYEDIGAFEDLMRDNAFEMPGAVVQAVSLMAGTFFEFTADNVVGGVAEIPSSAKSLLQQYRIYPYHGI